MTEAEKIICKLYLEDLDKYHTCNEYKLLMQMLEQEAKAEWIPVSQALPSDGCAVLVWCPIGENIFCAYRDNNEWWIFGSVSEKLKDDVIAWCELPKPYSEVE